MTTALAPTSGPSITAGNGRLGSCDARVNATGSAITVVKLSGGGGGV